MKDLTEKINELLQETHSAYNYNDPRGADKFTGYRPIQFRKWWMNFKPGDRCDVRFGINGVNIKHAAAGGYFSGIKKEADFYDEDADIFKSLEGDAWQFI